MKRIAFLLVLMAASLAQAALTAQIDANGNYQLVSDKPDWTFAGHIDAPITASHGHHGDTDRIGKFDEVDAEFKVNGVPLMASIRTYSDRPLALFSLEYSGPSDKGVMA